MEEQVRVVELTLWLGSEQKVRIKACKTLNNDPQDGADFERSGFPAKPSGADLLKLVAEILSKLQSAYPAKNPIMVSVEDGEIVATVP